MLICADYLDKDAITGEPKLYHGDFPVIINTDYINQIYVELGEYSDTTMYCHMKGRSFFYVVAVAKDGTKYRISDIHETSSNYEENPRSLAIDDMFSIMDALATGDQYCRKVMIPGGVDYKWYPWKTKNYNAKQEGEDE